VLETGQEAAQVRSSARERILDVAYELFSRRGIRAVGVNEVIERAGVATATLYRHFPSK
jgi:AcrR family transcriptional regulator